MGSPDVWFQVSNKFLSKQIPRHTRRITQIGVVRCGKCASDYKHLSVVDDVA